MEDFQPSVNTTAFLFGNIDKKGQLEAEDEELQSINKLSDCRLEEINSTIDSLFSQPEPPQHCANLPNLSNNIENDEKNYENVNPVDFYDENEYIEDIEGFNTLIDTAKIISNQYNQDDYDDCVITGESQEATNQMPPPSEVPHNKRNIAHFTNTVSQFQTNDIIMSLNQNESTINTLNTPLGSILPPEYANVDIQTLFPHYHHDKIPRWSKLFKTFHEPQLYRPLDQWKANPPENPFADLNSNINNDQNCIFNDYNNINMGVYPPPEMMMTNDADTFRCPAKSFADCEVPVPFRDIQPCGNNNSINNNIVTETIANRNQVSQRMDIFGNNNYQKRLKRKRKRDDRLLRFKGGNNGGTDSTANVQKSTEVLTGLSWRDGPASYWYDMFNVPLDENILEYRIKPSVTIDDGNILSCITTESLNDEDCLFSTWQLLNWETDIIIDPQTVRNQILESNKKYACHAGWIPSIKHRNMATFQDANCSEYFGIWPASSTGTMVTSPDVSQWHSIFALENAQMTSGDWVSSIIIDPRHPAAQQPHLLELDLNNECIHFDFTNPQQTKEILTAELNTVYLSTPTHNLSAQSTAAAAAVEKENIAGGGVDNSNGGDTSAAGVGTASGAATETPNKTEKQLKKMKILSKLSELTEMEEKSKAESADNQANVTASSSLSSKLCLNKYFDRDSYIVVKDTVDRDTPFFMDIVPDSTLTSLIDNNNNNNNNNNNSSLSEQMALEYSSVTPLIRHGIQHSLPAIQLEPCFFPLKLDNQFLRHLHRVRLFDIKQQQNTMMMKMMFESPQSISNIVDMIKIESGEREKVCQLTGCGDLFFMRSLSDLTANTDRIILAEYSEEFPPLMMQTGMASRIINYFHGPANQPVVMPQLPYGELSVGTQIPFLGQLSSNQIFQALENNMFRAPLYPHRMRSSDFLVTVRCNSLSVRRVDDIFLVGQQLPLMEVPAPNSKKANTFLKDFLQVQIIRMFLQSQTEPKRIRHEEIKSMFSEQSDSALKKRLKIFAEYKKPDVCNSSGFWVLKPEFQLPTEDELIELITPEECCSYYSMMWGLCRLEDAGYNSKSFIQADPEQQDEDEEKESNLKIEDEVKAAPWHTTKTFLDAQKGKCYLELLGATEPTGCGEGFSYARVSAKGSLFKETLNKNNSNSNSKSAQNSSTAHGQSGTHVPGVGKRMVTGTDADLRKLTLKKAHALLKDCGISEHDIKKLKRWDIIDLVRQMSTQKANQGEEEAMVKFARSSKMTVAGQEERYKSECQRIFNLQNQVLANEEELTSDDDDDGDDNNNGDGNDEVEDVYNRKFNRGGGDDGDLDLFRISETNSVADGGDNGGVGGKQSYSCLATADNARAILKFKNPVPKAIPKALCIRRQIDDGAGGRTTHTQTIPWSTIVKIYFKMCQEHKPDYLRNFCGLNHYSKEEEKKARRKQQDKIRRLKRQQKQQKQKTHHIGGHDNGNNNNTNNSSNIVKKKYRPKVLNSVQLKAKMHTTESLANINCGACGNKGHMRTNKECPLYGKSVQKAFSKRALHRPPQNNNNNNNNSSQTIFQLLNPDKDPLYASSTVVQESEHHLEQQQQQQQSQQQSYIQIDDDNDEECRLSLTEDSVNHHLHHYQDDNGTAMDTSIFAQSPSIVNEELKLVIPKQLIAQYQSNSAANMMVTQNCEENYGDNDDGDNDDGGVCEQEGNNNSRRMISSSSNSRKMDNNNSSLKRQHSSVLKKVSKTSQNVTMTTTAASGGSTLSSGKQNEYILDQKMRGNRRRIDPRVALNHQFEEIYKGLLQVAGYRCFLHPVRKRECPNYYSVIDNPMDLSTVKMKINKNFYETRESFLEDIKLIYDNCHRFNGESNEYTAIARQLMSYVMEQFCAKERKLMRLERLVNPLMDEDDMVGLRYILEQTVTAMEEMELSRPFHTPVDKKKYPDYLEKISGTPMDLQSLRQNIKSDKYKSRDQFLADVDVIVDNCVSYNGEASFLTTIARRLVEVAKQIFRDKEATLATLEANLRMKTAVGAEAVQDSQMEYEEEECENDGVSSGVSGGKRRRLQDSETLCEEDKVSISTGGASTVDNANRERIMADLQLTDSDDNIDEGDGEQQSVTSLGDNKSTKYYQNSETNYSEHHNESPPQVVTFYISDDDD